MEPTHPNAEARHSATVQTVTTVKPRRNAGGWAKTIAVVDLPKTGFSEINWQINNAMVQ